MSVYLVRDKFRFFDNLRRITDIATATTVRTFQKLTLTIGFGTFVLITLATAITDTALPTH